jgi:hypothetical protein
VYFSKQIWDNDLFSPDDYVGNIDLVLTDMFKPAKSARECKAKNVAVTPPVTGFRSWFSRSSTAAAPPAPSSTTTSTTSSKTDDKNDPALATV